MKYRIIIPFFILLLITYMSCKKETDATAVETSEPVAAKDVPPASEKYITDTSVSIIEWKGSKPTGSHTGTLCIAEGDIFVKEDSLETGSFIIDMNSLNVTDPKEGEDKLNLENHLKGLKEGNADHFFNVTKYPTGIFEITGIATKENKNVIEGNLTLKDITKNISFPASVSVNGDSLKIVSETFKIDRTLWNINYSSKSVFENIGDKYIDDNIQIKVNVRAYREDKK